MHLKMYCSSLYFEQCLRVTSLSFSLKIFVSFVLFCILAMHRQYRYVYRVISQVVYCVTFSMTLERERELNEQKTTNILERIYGY